MSDDRAKVVKRALSNPFYFAERYVRPYDPNWVEPLPQFADDMLRFVRQAKRGVVMLPPEFLKTTLISQVYPLWLTYRYTAFGKLLRGMLASEEEGLAVGNLGVIAWHIEHNELLRADFSDEQGRPLVFKDPEEDVWRSDSIVVNRSGTSKDPTWQAKGLDSKGVQGRRLDFLIADDLITPKNAGSPALRKRALDFWDLQFETRLVGDGQALICGNFNDARDLLSTLAARSGYKVFRRPSIHKPGEPDRAPSEGQFEQAECTWPQVWPKVRLLEEKRQKPNRFRRIHLLDARAEMGEQLKVEWLTVIEPEQTPWRSCGYFIALDPAPGGEVTEDLDYFNVSVGALGEQHLDLVESIDVRRDVASQVELVGAVHDRYQRLGRGVIAIGGAKIAMDRYLTGAITISRPDLRPKLVEVSIPGSKEDRLEALGPYAKTRWLRVQRAAVNELTSDPGDQWQELTFIEQWRDFPHGTHDDKLDGTDVLCRLATEFGSVTDIDFDVAALEA